MAIRERTIEGGVALIDPESGNPASDLNNYTIPDLVRLAAGKATVPVGGTGDYALGSVVESDKRTLALVLTGTLTGNRNILTGTTEAGRFFIVHNTTSGAFTLTVKVTSGGTGVAVPQGSAYLLWHDGTTVYQAGGPSSSSLPSDYISGLRLEWVSATSIKIKTGSAMVNGSLVTVAADITLTFTGGSALGPSAWYHIYLVNSTTAEHSTTAPALYAGTAHQKTGDATRRYVGSIKTDASNNVFQFIHEPRANFVRWLSNVTSSPFRTLTAGLATAETEIDCSGAVPVTSRFVQGQFSNTATNIHSTFGAGSGAGDDSVAPPTTTLGNFGQQQWPVGIMALSDDQRLSYAFAAAPSGGGGYFDVWGYYFER